MADTRVMEQEQEEPANGETGEVLEIDRIEALYAADIEPQQIPIPGWDGCWISVAPMTADGDRKFQTAGVKLTQRAGGGDSEWDVDVNERELTLLVYTIRDFCLRRRVRVVGAAEPQYQWTEVRASAVKDEGRRREFMRNEFRQHTRQLRRWMVEQCLRVNGLSDIMGALAGNTQASSND